MTEALRDAVARATQQRLKGRDWATFCAALSLTAGRSRPDCSVYVSDVAAAAGHNERSVRASLKKLHALGVLTWLPQRGVDSTGDGQRSFLSLEARICSGCGARVESTDPRRRYCDEPCRNRTKQRRHRARLAQGAAA